MLYKVDGKYRRKRWNCRTGQWRLWSIWLGTDVGLSKQIELKALLGLKNLRTDSSAAA